MTTTFRSKAALTAALAAAALLSLLAVLHVADFQTHVHARLAHHRTLRQLQAQPTLQMLFHAKRDSMKIHGHTDFAVLVQPSANGSINNNVFEFNGVATFVDGETTHTYKLVDGVAYYETETSGDASSSTASASVVPSSELPPIHELLESIAAATPIDSVETTQAIDCPSTTQLFHGRFSGVDYVLCGFESDEVSGMRLYSEDFNVEIRTSVSSAMITKPTSVDTSATTDKVPASTRRLSTSMLMDAVTHATADSVARMLSPRTERKMELQAATCTCKSKPRPCIFFHGMDIKADGGLLDDYDFFGDIKKHAPCCSTVKFAVLNTVDFAWNNASLVDKACGYALSMSPTSDKTTGTIEDTIVIAHSMGNLMVAHAEVSGKCKLGSTSSWVSLSGPFKGSMGSDFQQQICEGDYFAKEVVAAVVALFGQCPQSRARQALTYEGGEFSSAKLNAQYNAAQFVHQKRVTAGVCGYKFNGLLSSDWAGLLLGGSILPHKSKENDGVVEFQSCIGNLSPSQFGEDWSNTFYRAKLNHADTTFKNGDAWFDNAQKPVKWFECLAL